MNVNLQFDVLKGGLAKYKNVVDARFGPYQQVDTYQQSK
jgi:hypothetical protein